jgi:plastocyanin
MTRFGSILPVSVALSALLGLAGCAELFPPFPPSQPATTIHGSVQGSVSVAPPAAIAVYATQANGNPVGDILVYAQPLDARIPATTDAPAVLNILERHFEPTVLPVRAGGSVTIQNLDGVAHDVYSFSPVHPLSLHLAVGERETRLTFRHTGVVAIGCKVYNDMQGYIYVTDAPYFGLTDSQGYLRLGDLPPGRYRLGVWRAGTSDQDLPGYPRTLTLKSNADEVVHVHIHASDAAGFK